jgi:hypothetical protein
VFIASALVALLVLFVSELSARPRAASAAQDRVSRAVGCAVMSSDGGAGHPN